MDAPEPSRMAAAAAGAAIRVRERRMDAPEPSRMAAAAALLAGVALLGGCGSSFSRADGPQAKAIKRTSIAIDYASYYPPIDDVRRLATARAAEKNLKVTFTGDSAGAAPQAASLKTLTGAAGGFGVVAVAPFDPAGVGKIAASAGAQGVKVVSYLTPVAHQTAGITVDVQAAATTLVEDVVAARPEEKRPGRLVVIVPPASSPVPDPLAAASRAGAAAVKSALAAAGIAQPATVTALGEADARQLVRAALRSSPEIDTVIAWSDATALGASAELRSDGYVAALAPGGVASAQALRMIEFGKSPIQELVAPRLRDLANALIDVPAAVLAGKTPTAAQTTVPVQRFTRTAPATRAALADYAG